MRYSISLFLSLAICTSCVNNSVSEKLKPSSSEKGQPLTGDHFTAEKIGWTIKLPDKDWKIVPKKDRQSRNKETTKEIEEVMGTEIDISRIEQLIGFSNINRSIFESSIEPFDENQFGGYDNNLALQRELLKKTYSAKNIQSTYEIGASRIGGVMLDWLIMKIQVPEKKKVFTTRIYNCLRNNYFLTIVIGYDNVEDEETLLSVVYSSKFKDADK